MKRSIFTLLVLVAFATSISGTDVSIDYIDGYLDVKEGGEWYELYIGEVITDADTIRLDENSVAELSLPGTTLTLTRPGIYVIADLLEASGERRSTGLGSVIGNKLKSIVKEPEQGQTAVMGVRGSKSENKLEWMSGDTAELLEAGIDHLAEENYAEAVGVFEEAYEFADIAEETEVLFYLGLANAMMGQIRFAVEALENVDPDPASQIFTDLILLKGQLLHETFAYQEAVDWLETYTPELQDDASTQMSLLLTGSSHKGLGNTDMARNALEAAVAIDASSDAGQAAQNLIGEL
jgi:tetratricopeptide (TPR) repeat protein